MSSNGRRSRLIIIAPSNHMDFSGTPYALARALDGVQGLPFELVHSHLEPPRKFRLSQFIYAARQARWKAKNGFSLSSYYMSAAWTRSNTKLCQGDVVIVCHSIAPRQVVAAAHRQDIRLVTYVDMSLNKYFNDYDLKNRIPTLTRRFVVDEEAKSLSVSWRILTLDEEGARGILEDYRQIDPLKIISIGRGANIQSDQLDRIRKMRRSRNKNACLEILFIGKDAARKGLYEAIEGIQSLPSTIKDKVILHVVGPDKAQVPDLSFVKRYGLLNRDKSPDLYVSLLARADLGLLLTKAEGNPGSVAEFLACGVPTVASNLPHLVETFHGAAVVFVSSRNMASGFSDLLATMIEEPATLTGLAELAERERDRFTWIPVVHRLLHCLQE